MAPDQWQSGLLRFVSVCTSFMLLILFCVLAGWQANQAHVQRSAVMQIVQAGGTVEYSHRFEAIHNDAWVRSDAQPPGPKWLRRLIGDEYFTSVISVELSGSAEHHVDDIMAAVGKFKSLRFLDLQNQLVTDVGIAHIRKLTLLERLLLSGTNVTDHGLRHLAHLNSLVELELDDTTISDAGLLNARIGDKHRLHTLSLLGTKVSNETLDLLRRLPKLDLLSCGLTGVTDDAVHEFKQSCPNVAVVY